MTTTAVQDSTGITVTLPNGEVQKARGMTAATAAGIAVSNYSGSYAWTIHKTIAAAYKQSHLASRQGTAPVEVIIF